jgi:hypothetical protein
MNEELLNELIQVRAKARLSPKTSYRFGRLEDFIAYTQYLSTYTQSEKDRLLAEFNKLSDQEKQALWNNATQRGNAASFYLSDEDREKLEAGKKNLSFHERARISDGYIRIEGLANTWLDFGEVSEAIIEIDDSSAPERQSRPYAYIGFSNGYWRRVETIDIFESIKANPASIGHPAIVFAIYHWQRVIYTRRVIKRDEIGLRDGWEQALKDEFEGGDDLRIAAMNLKAISQTLYDAAWNRAISKEAALALKMDWYGLRVDDVQTVLHFAWEKINTKSLSQFVEKKKMLEKVVAELREFEMRPHTDYRHKRVSSEKVMEFLSAPGKRGGRKYVGFDKNGKSLRPRWKVFRNAFAARFFGLEQSALQDYLEKSTKQNVMQSEIYEPTITPPRITVSGIWHYLLATPLASVQEPIWVSEDDMGFNGVADAIEKAISKGANDQDGK